MVDEDKPFVAPGVDARRPSREAVIEALTEMLRTHASSAKENRYDRRDAIMDAIVRVLDWQAEASGASPNVRLARSYAARAVQNLIIDAYRRERPVVDDADIENIAAPNDGASQLPTPWARASVQLFEALSGEDQDLLRAYFAGQDYFREESVKQALKPGTARVRVHRLLVRLRKRGTRLISEQAGGK